MSTFDLSSSQRAAVQYTSNPAIVTAGAGSGKTRTLTTKIAHLINEKGFDPARILAITFTNKAAGEMKSRVGIATGRSPTDFPWIRTFHSACFRILKEHCDLLGYAKPLLIHDESQQKAHLKKTLAELDLDRKYLSGAAAMISNAKNSGDPLNFIRHSGRLPRKGEIFRLYNESLEQSNSVDFDDILLLTRDLLNRFPEIRLHYQNSFDYILIDEFQDSNDIQNQIVDLLVLNGNLTVVGDDYQSIYKFRGADPRHFINFPAKYDQAKVFRLEENFRSTAQIVAAADGLISFNARRIDKKCYSRRQGEPIQVAEFPTDGLEAAWVAKKCWDYIQLRRVPLEKIAILYRTKFTSLPFERALRQERIPYTMVGAQGFFQRREVQDLNCYLICAVNGKDDVSFERIINVPRRSIGPGAMNKILQYKDRNLSLQEAAWKAVEKKVLPKKTSAALEALLRLLQSLSGEKPSDALQRVMEEVDYGEYVRSFAESPDDAAGRMENIQQMVFDASQKATIAEYLEDAALLREDQDASEQKNGIRLSTIHAAKGLEYKVVFLVAVEEGVLPHHRSVNLLEEDDREDAIEEERRLMYVAMTRASDFLHITFSRMRRGEWMPPSRFLDEIPSEHLLGSS